LNESVGISRAILCACCAAPGKPAAGEGFARALAARLADEAGIVVETTECMNICARPVALALKAEGKPAYLFAGLDPARDLEDAVALCRLYAQAGAEGILDARPAGRLRFCLVGRVPV
jgi:predicted metal-binding protein